jgi:hypothetical protein
MTLGQSAHFAPKQRATTPLFAAVSFKFSGTIKALK